MGSYEIRETKEVLSRKPAMTPDRWDKMVEKIERNIMHRYATSMSKANAVKLLRRQHSWFVRMVTKARADVPFDIPRQEDELTANRSYHLACDKILSALAKQKGVR